MGAHAYAYTNKLQGLAAGAFTWSNAYAGADRVYVNDGRMDKRMSVGNVATTVNVVIDFGTATALNGFALLNHNLVVAGGTATVKVEGADNAAITTNAVTAKTLTLLASYLSANTKEPMNKDHVLQFTDVVGSPVSKRYWRLTFAWIGTINPTFGEIFAYASPTQLSRKSIYGGGDSEEMYTSELKFGNGETRGLFQGGPVRMKTLRWADLSVSEKNEVKTLWYAGSGNAGKVLFIPSYESGSSAALYPEQDVIYGRLSGVDGVAYPELDYNLLGFTDLVVRSLGREVGA